jgi:tRNA(Ile2) C34 agmatinyltransferase TiaS
MLSSKSARILMQGKRIVWLVRIHVTITAPGERDPMTLTKDQVSGLAKTPRCPRCDLNKTIGNALCRSCRAKLPENMRQALERIPSKDAWTVSRAVRAAARYFDVHFQSVRNFGGGRPR